MNPRWASAVVCLSQERHEAALFLRRERARHKLRKMELYTFAGNTHALQSLIIARYNDVEISVPPFEMGKDNKTPAFLAKSPMGKVPVLSTAEGCICEAAAIARYVARMRADTNMYGGSFYEAGLVDQWIEFAKNELDLPIGMWIYPILGFIQSNAANTAKAQEDVKKALAVLEAHLLKKTFLVGEAITAADVVVACSLLNAFKLVFDAPFLAPFVAVKRWFSTCVAQPEFVDVLGPTAMLCAEGAAPAKAAAPAAEGKKEKAPQEKKEKPAKEEKKKEEKKPKEEKKKEEKKDDKPAGPSAKDIEKARQKIIKEGGKKGVEIEGASELGGLDFFCTTVELPEGNIELLELSMLAMNAEPDPEAEDRKGCSGLVGKMIFSAGVEQLAMVAYVPDKEFNKSSDKVDTEVWMNEVCKAVSGQIVKGKTAVVSLIPDKRTGAIETDGKIVATDGKTTGNIVCAVVKSDPEKGKFALKDKDAAMAAAFAFLRSKGAFPEDDGDDSDEMIFGDDDNLDDYA